MNSKNAYHQNVGLSSKDKDFPETKATLSQIDLSKFPDGTQVVQVHPYVVLDIPDCYFEQFPSLNCKNEQQYPCNGYLSEEHRKEQLVYLNGR